MLLPNNYILTWALLVMLFIVVLFLNTKLVKTIGVGTALQPTDVRETFWNNRRKRFDVTFNNQVEFMNTNKDDRILFNPTKKKRVVTFKDFVKFKGDVLNRNGIIMLKENGKIKTEDGISIGKTDLAKIKDAVKKINYTNDHARSVSPVPNTENPFPSSLPLKTLGNNQCTKTLGRIIKGTCTTQTAKDICQSCACNPSEDNFSLSIKMRYKNNKNKYSNLSLYLTNNTSRYTMQSMQTNNNFDADFYIKTSDQSLKWVLLFLNESKYDFLDIDTRNKNYAFDFMKSMCESGKSYYMVTSKDIPDEIRNERVTLATLYRKTNIPKSNMVILLVAY